MYDDDSLLIRSIDHLELDDGMKEIAEQLITEIDMPLVFWMGSKFPMNTGVRHPKQNNEFWITVDLDAKAEERDRLILSGMYRAIQEKNRYWKIRCVKDEKLKQLVGLLGSIGTSLDVELFLQQFNVKTGFETIVNGINLEKRKLREYIDLRGIVGFEAWDRETKLYHVLSCGALYRHEIQLCEELKVLAGQIGEDFYNDTIFVLSLIDKMRKAYDGSNGNELVESFIKRFLTEYSLIDSVDLCKLDYYKGVYPTDEGPMPIFSYIPMELPNQKQLIEWMRLVRTLICNYRGIVGYDSPDVLINLIDTSKINSYADGTSDTQYAISFTRGLVDCLYSEIEENEAFHSFQKRYGEILGIDADAYIRRMIAYFVVAHEYAHILLGHCDDGSFWENPNKEKDADQLARKIVKKAVLNEHRYKPSPPGESKKMIETVKAKGIKGLDELFTEERKKEIEREVRNQLLRLNADEILLEEAISFIDKIRNSETS